MSQLPTSSFPLDPDEQRVLVRIARLYYQEDLTQEQIARLFDLSRVKVNRLLRRARELGIVQVTIQASDSQFDALEHALCMQYQLRDALVAPECAPGEPLYAAIAQSTAGWLTQRLKPGMRVGLGMGRTIAHLPEVFKPAAKIDCAFTDIVGGAAENSGGLASYNVISSMAEISGGKAEYIYAPLILSSSESAQALLREPSISNALERARRADILIQSVGPVDSSALLYLHGYLTTEDLADLRARGAIGDVLGHYVDACGEQVPTHLDNRRIGLTLNDIQRAPWSVVIGGGADKIPVLRAGLRAKLFNAIVTDEQTAHALLSEV